MYFITTCNCSQAYSSQNERSIGLKIETVTIVEQDHRGWKPKASIKLESSMLLLRNPNSDATRGWMPPLVVPNVPNGA